jgi:RNA polymerase sigma-70 factor (ECF subfamily)
MRLTRLLLEHPPAAIPVTHALAALMCLHAARLPGRVDAAGNLSMLIEQDRSKWDAKLVAEGQRLLDLSATGLELSEYHAEAGIAALHANARTLEETDWRGIVSLYDMLMSIRPSPIVALNRAIAVAQLQGPERGLEEVRAIAGSKRLAAYPFYSAAIGELELRAARHDSAREHFRAALALARNPMERRFLEQRLGACEDGTRSSSGKPR